MISTNIYLFIIVVIVVLMRTEGGRLALFVTFLGFRFFVMPLTAFEAHTAMIILPNSTQTFSHED